MIKHKINCIETWPILSVFYGSRELHKVSCQHSFELHFFFSNFWNMSLAPFSILALKKQLYFYGTIFLYLKRLTSYEYSIPLELDIKLQAFNHFESTNFVKNAQVLSSKSTKEMDAWVHKTNICKCFDMHQSIFHFLDRTLWSFNRVCMFDVQFLLYFQSSIELIMGN